MRIQAESIPTNVACKLLDLNSCRCADYRHRRMHVPDCIRLTRRTIDNYPWLPSTCAYVLRANGEPLPDGIIWSAATKRLCIALAYRSKVGQYPNSMLDRLKTILSNSLSDPKAGDPVVDIEGQQIPVRIKRTRQARRISLRADAIRREIRITMPVYAPNRSRARFR
jgi:hypothetical protein